MDAEERSLYITTKSQGIMFLTVFMMKPRCSVSDVPLHYSKKVGSDGTLYFTAKVQVMYDDWTTKTFGFVVSTEHAITCILEADSFATFLKTGDVELLKNSVQELNVTPHD